MGTEGEEERGRMIMDDPIPIKKDTREPASKPTFEEWTAARKQTHDHRVQTGFFVVLGLVILGLVIPLSVWLTRLALGG